METRTDINNQNTQPIRQDYNNPKIQLPWLITIIILTSLITFIGSFYIVNYYNSKQKDIVSPPKVQEKGLNFNVTPTIKPISNQSKFAFLREGDVWVSDNNQQKKLTDYKYNYSVKISQDLSKIAYFSTPLDEVERSKSYGHIGGYGPLRNIWVINSNGTEPEKLTASPGLFSELKFSPNGKYLSYINPTSSEILIIDLSTENIILHQPTNGVRTEYGWGPESDRLIIYQDTIDNSSKLVGFDIFEVDLNSKNLKKIGSVTPFGGIHTKPEFLASPNLKYLAYFGKKQNVLSYGVSSYDWGYWLANLDGTNPKELLVYKNKEKDHGPTINFNWSPDGNYLAFIDENFNETKTTLKVYEITSGILYTIEEAEGILITWDQSNNLYLRAAGTTDISKVDFKAKKLEKFLGNAEEITFGQ